MDEDELRAVFARHEHLTPAAEPLKAAIREGYRRRWRRRLVLRSVGAAAVALSVPVPVPLSTVTPPALRPGPLTFVLAGIDRPPGADVARSDTVLIAHVPAARDKVYLVSVLRDSYVSIPGHGRDKLNAAYAYGGFPLLQQTLRSDFGIAVDGGAVADFTGLQRVVDSIGGVDMYVDEDTVSIHIGWTKDGRQKPPYLGTRPVPGVTPQRYRVGYQHLTGWQAVDFVRQRVLLPHGDADRQRHVRQFLTALLTRARSLLSDPQRASAFLDSLQQAITVDTGGMALLELLRAVDKVGTPIGLQAATSTLVADGMVGEVLTPDGTSLLAAVAHDDVDAWIAAHPGAVS